jgi:hypothetical protein
MNLFLSEKRSVFFLLIFFIVSLSKAQQIPEELNSIHGNFQIDAQYYMEDTLIKAPKVSEQLLSNVFGNINYTKGRFSAGVRYEAYNNLRQGFVGYKGEGIANRYARYQTDLLDVTVGNFYEQFGNGLMLRAYYEPGLLYDNSIDGARVISMPHKGITFKGVIGKQRLFFGKGTGIVRGFDGEVNVNELFDSILGNKKTKIILGGSFVSKYEADADPNLKLPENVGCYGGRINIIREGFNFNSEYAYKINDPSFDNKYSYKFGDALFVSTSYATTGFSVLLQLKRIDNMSYRSERAQTIQNLLINYLPATTKQHSYSLLAMNPYATQLRGEIGFMGEVQYKIKRNTPLGGKYGMEITLNYSQANGLKQYAVRDSASRMTFYQTKWDFAELGTGVDHYDSVLVTPPTGGSYYEKRKVTYDEEYRYYHDFFIEINKKFNKKVKATFIYSNQFYNRNQVQDGSKFAGYPNLNANIGVIDITYRYKTTSSVRIEMQGLFTRDQHVETNASDIAKGNWAAGLIEWWPTSEVFIAVFDQYNYGNPDAVKKIHYYLGSIGYNKGPHRISLSYGKQSKGIFCVGGVCRQVPASNGITLSITSSF